ncbi:hypothetical protein ABWH96_14455 [Marivirga tractuosa]|uniref:aromatic-ring hydroxylase C-terminal domain-containing protein n=1 Tax=Marivirga tractuosa TaxID=1006 RepID=UPI0035CFB1BA
MAKLKDNNPTSEQQREDLRKAIALKSYEFNCHGVELNQRYNSEAIVSDGSGEEEYLRDQELYYQASTRPGTHLPHVWLGDNGHRISTLDVSGKGKMTLFTGIGGEDWIKSAEELSKTLNIEIETVQIGPDRDYTDLYGEWAEIRNIKDSGCLLIRPDYHIAYRATEVSNNSKEALQNALNQVLGL